MRKVKQVQLINVLNDLPDIIALDCEKEFTGKEYDIYLCALGFEQRCLKIPEQLSKVKDFKCKQAIYFEYATNIEDNEVNKQRLIRAFGKFADSCSHIKCDIEDFTKYLRDFFKQISKSEDKLKIIFDISVCSSKLLISVIKVLFEFEVYLMILYSEAAIYHPTCDEFSKHSEEWTTEEGFGTALGVGDVIPSGEYPGARRENPDLIIAFPTFKPERTKAIITYIDESIFIRPEKRIIWMVGDPHMNAENKIKRKAIIRQINKISEEDASREVCTFDYKKTLVTLDQIYNNKNLDFHINISALGSKMQSLGIALFCYIRPDISIYHAVPDKYNPKQYSEGCKATWQISFGDLLNIRNILNRVGKLEIIST